MNFQVKITGVVHSLEEIRSPVRYASATFSTIDNLEVRAEGKRLYFKYSNWFNTDDISALLEGVIQGTPSNVEFELDVK